jgi:hypothetical protein
MRARLAIVLALAALVTVAAPWATRSALGDPGAAVLAQEGGGDPAGPEQESEGQESTGGEGEGQGAPGAETGAGGETEGGEATTTGVPWTYQMARLSVLLLVLLVAAIGLMYYRLVAKRQRGAA